MAKPRNPAACWRPAGSIGEPAHRCHSPRVGSVTIAAPRISRGRASGSGSVRISTTAIAGEHDRHQNDGRPDQDPKERVDPLADGTGGVEPGAGGDHHGDTQQRQRDAVAAVAGLEVAGPADRAGGGSGALGQHQPARADAPADGRPRRRNGRRVAAEPACGGAPRDAPDAIRPVNRPLTWSNGLRSGRRSYWAWRAKPSRRGPIFTICHTGHRKVQSETYSFTAPAIQRFTIGSTWCTRLSRWLDPFSTHRGVHRPCPSSSSQP